MTPDEAAGSNGGNGQPTDITVHVFGRTDVGRTREHNEDAFVVCDLTADNATLQPEVRTHKLGERGTLFMVADGMGGAAAGEIASAMAVDVILNELRARWIGSPKRGADAFAVAIKDATEAANSKIHTYAAEHPEHRGMGTTATIAGMLGDKLYVAQVGDSRAYLVRDGVARQITKDQSLIQKLVEAGELTPEEAEQSERRNIILQALGPESHIKVDLTVQQIRSGDLIVLCSDGLSGQIKTEDISRIANDEPDLVSLCRKLIDLANANGGPDNITVVTARFSGAGLARASSEDHVGHRAFRLSGEARATMPMSPEDTDLISEVDTAESPAVIVSAMDDTPTAPIPAVKPVKTVEIAAGAPKSALAPMPRDPRRLNMIIGASAIVAIGFALWYYFWRE